jgi:hypothetical protein
MGDEINMKQTFRKQQNFKLEDIFLVITNRIKKMLLYLFLNPPLLLHNKFILIRIYQHKIGLSEKTN